jgi:thiamine biosynthesis lipoprotein
LNRHAADGPIVVERRLFHLLQLAQTIWRETEGAFDLTSGPLSKTWGFFQRQGRLPSEDEIAEALSHVGFDRVRLDAENRTVRFTQTGAEVNLNSIGKGYALDRAAEVLDSAGVSDYLWHGGSSSVLARGRNRADRRGAWTLGLQHPLRPAERLAEFHLRDRALGTAGGGTQFFEHAGRRYAHLLDPRRCACHGFFRDGNRPSGPVLPPASRNLRRVGQ